MHWKLLILKYCCVLEGRSSLMYLVRNYEMWRRSIKDKTSEFTAAVNYIKPDIICGTESWLKGEKPGKNPTKDAIKSSEIVNSDVLSFILLQFTVNIFKFLFAGRLNTLLLFDLFLLVFIFDVVVYELFVLGLLALSGLNALEVTDSKVLLCVRGS
jgi:hypothetical protein